MAQRATGFARKPVAAKASREDERAREIAETPSALRALPFDLAPMVSPYKGHGRLSLRVEQLPSQMRLSAGRNNGDNSWSLSLDELEDLAFLAPENFTGSHKLAIRIVALDGVAATTLAVLELVVSSDGPERTHHDATAKNTPDPGYEVHLRRLREELSKVKSALALREAELIEAQQTAEQAELEFSAERIERELAAARGVWQIELDEKLAAVRAERNSGVDTLTLDSARKRWQQESDAALVKAKAGWKTEEAARFAAAEAQWRKQSDSALAKLTARCQSAEAALAAARAPSVAAPDHRDAELQRLHDELDAAQTVLAERDTSLAQLQLNSVQALERLRQEAKATLSKAQADWKAGEAARLSAAEARALADSKTGEAARLATAEAAWRKQSASALAELTARFERTETELAQARALADIKTGEASRLVAAEAQLRNESAAAITAATARCERAEAALARTRTEIETVQAQVRAEAETALAHARSEADSALVQARAEADSALAQARTDAEIALTAAHAEADAAHDLADTELRGMREKLLTAKATLTEREAMLAQLRLSSEQARERLRQESEAALAKAKDDWNAGEAGRFAAVETHWRKQTASTLAEAKARYEAAEMALAQMRVKVDAARQHTDDGQILHLQDKIAALQVTLAGREAELADALLGLDTRRSLYPENRIVIHQDRADLGDDALVRQRRAKANGRLLRDATVAATLVVSAIMFYPSIEQYLPEQLQWDDYADEPAPAAPASAAAPKTPAQNMAVIVHPANVRSGPSKDAAVVVTLPRGQQIALLKQQGNWTLVQIDAKNAKPQQGWVYSSFLKSAANPPKSP